MDKNIIKEQQKICTEYSAKFTPIDLKEIVGVSSNTNGVYMPINGLRHVGTEKDSGWFIWSGEILSKDHDFFKPMHAEHLIKRCPAVLKFLGLPPGYRFLIDTNRNYIDVWFDPTLLKK